MKETDFFAFMSLEAQRTALQKTNEVAETFGLSLSEEDISFLLEERKESLQKQGRVEFGEGILPQIIYAFCDSDYLEQGDYAETLCRLQDIFYQFKSEALEALTDEELLTFMREQFDEVCFGDLDYLENTCLKIFAEAVRAGYRGYQKNGGQGEYEQFDEIARWDRNLYLQALEELYG